MRVVGYIRVSTDRQAEQGLGLDVQKESIGRWCREHGHRLVAVHADEGVSGSNGLEQRIGLADALEDLRTSTAAGLVVVRLDRLARDLIIQEQLVAECRRIGAELLSCSPTETAMLGDDPDDPSRKLVRQVLGAVSEYERAMITLRLRAGRRRKAENGGYAYGAPPYGTTAVDHELQPVPIEATAVRRMQELRDEGMSLREIASELEAEGLRPRRSRTWHPKVIAAILRRSKAP